MKNISKYQGIIPAFYACYDDQGAISPERVEELTKYMIKKGVKGVKPSNIAKVRCKKGVKIGVKRCKKRCKKV